MVNWISNYNSEGKTQKKKKKKKKKPFWNQLGLAFGLSAWEGIWLVSKQYGSRETSLLQNVIMQM